MTEEQEYQPGENEWEIRPFETSSQTWRVFVSKAEALAEQKRALMNKYAISNGYRGLTDVVRKAVEAKRAEEAGGE